MKEGREGGREYPTASYWIALCWVNGWLVCLLLLWLWMRWPGWRGEQPRGEGFVLRLEVRACELWVVE